MAGSNCVGWCLWDDVPPYPYTRNDTGFGTAIFRAAGDYVDRLVFFGEGLTSNGLAGLMARGEKH